MDLRYPEHRAALLRLARAETLLLAAEADLRSLVTTLPAAPDDAALLELARHELRERRARHRVRLARRHLDETRTRLRTERRRVPAVFRRTQLSAGVIRVSGQEAPRHQPATAIPGGVGSPEPPRLHIVGA